MAAEIAELVKKIGCNEDELRRLLKVDQPYIDHLIARGYSRSEAENISFIGDLRKMVSILNAHTASAAAILKQRRGAPHGFVSTETEGEDDDNEQVANNEQIINNEDDQEEDADSSNLSSSSSSSGYANSISLSSSTEDEVEAKRLKLDPDYVPSGSSSSSTTPAETEPNSRVASDAEEELEGGETDTDSVVSSVNSQEELEPSDSPEESNDADDEDGEL